MILQEPVARLSGERYMPRRLCHSIEVSGIISDSEALLPGEGGSRLGSISAFSFVESSVGVLLVLPCRGFRAENSHL